MREPAGDIRSFDDAWRDDGRREGLAEVVPIDGSWDWPPAPSPKAPDRRRSAERPRARPEPGPEPAPQRRFAVVRVRTFSDARGVAEHLAQRTPVLLDLSGVDLDMARRIIDFSGGIIFGIRGHIERVDAGVFLLLPAGVHTD